MSYYSSETVWNPALRDFEGLLFLYVPEREDIKPFKSLSKESLELIKNFNVEGRRRNL